MNVISQIFSWINNEILKMTWLSNLIKGLVENVFGLSIKERLGGSVHFFIYDTIKIFILLSVLIFLISYIQSYFPPERTKKLLGNIKGIKGNILGALLGTITPFCSCSSIPIFIGFNAAGLPLGITFSFLISSPLVDLASLLILMSFFGAKIAIAYVVVGLILAVVGGSIIDKLGLEKYVEGYVKEIENVDAEIIGMTRNERISYSKEQVKDVFHKVWLYVLIGVGIGAAIHNWIPQSIIETVVGNNNPFAVLLATAVGIPMYADIFGTLPIAEALFGKGVGIGTVLSFMMAVTALSLPSIIMLSKVVKPKLLAIFVVIVATGIVIIGYLFNAFSFLLV
ncbi:permease [Clostridium tagluense]|uniref:permease n=1 Tax=Clostridium tagluense TaxID=360422 RepID=UPI001C0D2F0A|nr:permease [Clostridium tagluense]MBU3126798.1 permease [Clostridium tagluense]MCB2310474.1 permease [Clostridium tagluense]MCB2315360.1 permease [Clostridium tagluense]MCB2320211.1 permease [Clostridium tagluense]MCB2325102.1 permease [Clostridium tagluense]